MAGKEVTVKKYVVRLSAEERALLDAMIRKGRRPPEGSGAARKQEHCTTSTPIIIMRAG